jgi:hypothetical protein
MSSYCIYETTAKRLQLPLKTIEGLNCCGMWARTGQLIGALRWRRAYEREKRLLNAASKASKPLSITLGAPYAAEGTHSQFASHTLRLFAVHMNTPEFGAGW